MAVELQENDKFLSFLDYAVVGNRLYFSNDTFNALVEVDLDTRKVVQIKPFIDAEPLKGRRLHTGCVEFHNKLFFYFLDRAYIHVYDLKTGTQKLIEGPKESQGFFSTYIYQDKLYFLPYDMGVGLYCLDEEKTSLLEMMWWKKQKTMKYTHYCQLDDCRWAAHQCDKENIYLIDFSTEMIEKIETDVTVWKMAYGNQSFWYVPPLERDIYIKNIEDGTSKRFPFSRWDKSTPYENQWVDISVIEGKIILVSGDVSEICQFDPAKGELKSLCAFGEYKIDYDLMDEWIVEKKVFGRILVYTFCRRNILIKINLDTMQAERVILNMETQDIVKNYIDKINYEKAVIMSEKHISLQEFLDLSIAEIS